jgi:hypothetical protein
VLAQQGLPLQTSHASQKLMTVQSISKSSVSNAKLLYNHIGFPYKPQQLQLLLLLLLDNQTDCVHVLVGCVVKGKE